MTCRNDPTKLSQSSCYHECEDQERQCYEEVNIGLVAFLVDQRSSSPQINSNQFGQFLAGKATLECPYKLSYCVEIHKCRDKRIP